MRYILVIFFLLNFFISQAQKAWTLEECVAYAIKNNISIQLTEIQAEQQNQTLRQSRYEHLPDLNGRASHAYNWGRSVDPFTNQFINQEVQSNNFSLTSSMTLFNGFRIRYTVKQNQLNAASARYDSQKNKNDIMLSVATAFLQITLNQEQLKIVQSQWQNTDNQLQRTQILVQAGTLPEVNEWELRAQLATDEMRIVAAENALQLSMIELKQLLQIEAPEPFVLLLPDSLPTPPQVFDSPTPESIYQTAITQMPEIKSAELQIKSAELGVPLARAGLLPTISISGAIFTLYSSAQKNRLAGFTPTITTEPIGYFFDQNQNRIPVFQDRIDAKPIIEPFTFFNQLDQSLRRSISFDLTVPIFSRYRNRTAIQQASLRTEQAKLNKRQADQQLRQRIERAYYDALAAHRTYWANFVRLQASERSAEAIDSRYKAGVANVTEWQNATNNAVNARLELLRSRYDYWFKIKILDFYAGKPIKL